MALPRVSSSVLWGALSDRIGKTAPSSQLDDTRGNDIRQQIAEQSERRRQRFLREELDWVRAGVRAQRSKPRHRLESFYHVEGLEAPPEEREMDLLIPPAPEIGNVAMNLVDAAARVGEAQRWLFRHLTLDVEP